MLRQGRKAFSSAGKSVLLPCPAEAVPDAPPPTGRSAGPRSQEPSPPPAIEAVLCAEGHEGETNTRRGEAAVSELSVKGYRGRKKHAL